MMFDSRCDIFLDILMFLGLGVIAAFLIFLVFLLMEHNYFFLQKRFFPHATTSRSTLRPMTAYEMEKQVIALEQENSNSLTFT